MHILKNLQFNGLQYLNLLKKTYTYFLKKGSYNKLQTLTNKYELIRLVKMSKKY